MKCSWQDIMDKMFKVKKRQIVELTLKSLLRWAYSSDSRNWTATMYQLISGTRTKTKDPRPKAQGQRTRTRIPKKKLDLPDPFLPTTTLCLREKSSIVVLSRYERNPEIVTYKKSINHDNLRAFWCTKPNFRDSVHFSPMYEPSNDFCGAYRNIND